MPECMCSLSVMCLSVMCLSAMCGLSAMCLSAMGSLSARCSFRCNVLPPLALDLLRLTVNTPVKTNNHYWHMSA